jgi:hypothetical protein
LSQLRPLRFPLADRAPRLLTATRSCRPRAAGRDDERRAAARELLRIVDAHGLVVYRDLALGLA